MKKSKREFVRDSTARLQRAARERADEEARRIPWQRLYEVRNQYIDWQEFNFWARSILKVEERIVDWLARDSPEPLPGISLKRRKRSHPKQPRPGLWSSAWKIGLRIMSSASPSRKRLVLRKHVLRSTRPALPASRSVLVGVHREVEESQTGPVSVVRGVERHGGAM